MKLTFDTIRPGLYSMQFASQYDYATVTSEFKKEDWQSHADRKDTAGLAGDPYAQRSGLLNPKSAVLKDIMTFINSDHIKKAVIETLYQQRVSEMWEGWNQEQMFNKTFWGCMFNRDEPGFSIPVHLDTRLQVATAMIYFVQHDDPNQSTMYYTSDKFSDPVRVNNTFGNGVLHVNDHTAWHEGYNKSNVTRYSLICGLLLNVKDNYEN